VLLIPKNQCRHHFVKTEYSKNGSVIVRDAIICANLDGLIRIKPIEIDRDSVLSIFINSLQKLPIRLEIGEGRVFCNRGFITRNKLRYRKFKLSELISKLGNETNSVLIPIINYNYISLRNIYITSTGAVGGGGFTKYVHVDLAILIFRNKELEYFKSRVFFSPTVITDFSSDNIDFSIKQENIDTLVQLTMKDYIERMK